MYERSKLFDTSAYRNSFRPAGRAVRYIQEATSIDELVDVDAGSPANGDILEFDTISGMWKNVKKKHIGFIYTGGTRSASLTGTSSVLSVDDAKAGTLIVTLTANHTITFPTTELSFYCDTQLQDSRVTTIEVASAFSLTLSSNSHVEFRGTTVIPANGRAILYWNRIAGNKWQITPYVILASFNLPTINANQIVYDNSVTGIPASNVQAAIDDVNSRITASTASHLKQSIGPTTSGVISTATVTRDLALSSSVVLETIDAGAFPPDWQNAADGSSMVVWHSMDNDTTITYDSGTANLTGFTVIASCGEWQTLVSTGSNVFKKGKLFFNWIKQSGVWLLTIGYLVEADALLSQATETSSGVVRLATLPETDDGLSNSVAVSPAHMHTVVNNIASDKVDEKLIKSDKSQAESGISNDVFMTPLRTREAIEYNLPLLTGFADQGTASHLVGPQGAGIYTSTLADSTRYIWCEFPQDPITGDHYRLILSENYSANGHCIMREKWNPVSNLWLLDNTVGSALWLDSSDSADEVVNAINTLRSYATQAESTAGTNNTKVVTPLRVKQAIDSQRAYATQAEMTAGSNNTKVATPLRVKQAIDAHRPIYVSASGGTYSAGYRVYSNGDVEEWGTGGAGSSSSPAASNVSTAITLTNTMRSIATDIIITPYINLSERFVSTANVDAGSGTTLTVVFSHGRTSGGVSFRWRAFCRGYT